MRKCKGSEFIVELPVAIVEEEKAEHALIFESKVDKSNIGFLDIYSN